MHEMAHMWFGDLVTMQWWDDLWLKESFADYMGTLGVDRTTDWDTAWVNFANNRKAWAYVQDQLPTTHPIVADIPDLEAAKQNFDGITYAKGASVLKQLVAYVGFEAFIAGSRQYFKRPRLRQHHPGGPAGRAQRRLRPGPRRTGPASGCRPPASPPSPLEIEEHDGVLGAVTIVQDAVDPDTGRQELRPHRLRIGLYDIDDAGALVRTGSVETDVAGARTEVPDLGRQAAAGAAAGQRRGPQLRQGPAGPALRSHRAGLPGPDRRSDGPGPVLDRALGLGPRRRHAGVPLRGRRARASGPPKPASACC